MSGYSRLKWLATFGLLKGLRGALKQEASPASYVLNTIHASKPRMVNRLDYIVDFCKGKQVLHFGFADYPYTNERIHSGKLLHLRLRSVAKRIFGVDNNPESIQIYKEATGDEAVGWGDLLNKESLRFSDKSFDVILLGEVLEHLKNPHEAILNLYDAIPKAVNILITVPNYTSLQTIGASLHATETNHPDHFWYFSPETLFKLFPEDKFEFVELNFGMYFQSGKRINFILKRFPFLGECIIGVFKTK